LLNRLKIYYLPFFVAILLCNVVNAQHPVAFATKSDIEYIKATLKTNALLKQSFDEVKKSVDEWVGKDIDVPVPKDAAGGYTHDKHKANYTLMFNAAMMYQLTGDTKYAKMVKEVFLKYAALNPTIKNHPQATSSSPGRIFWQALNDANWLVYTGLAFDCIHDYLTLQERKQIADGAYAPIVNYFTKDLKSWFNLIHNHAVWACAGVGIVGIATDNKDYVDMALYGADKDKKAGFVAHLDGLFSPDGYYTEGPYYVRYALLPFYTFANSLNNAKPELKIFQHRNSILKKALDGGLQQTNLNGAFFSYNDALKEKTYISNEVVNAVNIAWQAYGANNDYLYVAKQQGRVTLSKGGASIAQALTKIKNTVTSYPYKTIEFTDGSKGDKGGVSILRSGKGNKLTTLIYKYSSHGLSHGHYDKLNINLYDNGNEILEDYGAVRYINIEQKWGGRYLPETNSYAQQTIAHNTVVVDEKSHYGAKESVSENYNAFKFFGEINDSINVVCAKDTTANSNTVLQRSIYMINLNKSSKPIIVDFFRVNSASQHQYDLPFHYLGTFISSNFKYNSYLKNQETLGTSNGYQHLWKEADARNLPQLSQVTLLNNGTFYTISSVTDDSTKVLFARVGANDQNFNLRHDPAFIYRKNGANQFFYNVIEPHGNFDAVAEVSTNAYSSVKKMEVLLNSEDYSVFNVTINNKKIIIAQSNNNNKKDTSHSIKVNDNLIEWKGPYTIIYK
jgi:hypothetical protein